MKLRNNKTGLVIDTDIADIKFQSEKIIIIPEPIMHNGLRYAYRSLSKLKEDWEDYTPPKPLIKDQKIRKAVRAWAETNSINKIIIFDNINDSSYVSAGQVKFAEFGGHLDVKFRTDEKFDTNKIYTITKLCGEEEE